MMNLERAYRADGLLDRAIEKEGDGHRKENLLSLKGNLHDCKKAILGANSLHHMKVVLPQTLKAIERELNVHLDWHKS
jgi:hypothetical protein